MLDFLKVCERYPKRGTVEIYPEFLVKPSKDLMIKGSSFYAIWDESANLWSTDEFRATELIDQELAKYAKEHESLRNDNSVKVLYLINSSNGTADRWKKYVKKQMPDYWKPLDERLIFANDEVKRSDYASKILPYPLEQMPTPYYDELTSVLYSPDELKKIEWAIGAIITGDSKKIQKFEVLYGSAGTGKGTMLEIIRRLFDGYYCTFEAKALGSANSAFALEPFKNNPLVAIQFDGDLSKIEDNTRLNSLVSHEEMIVNEKFKNTYTSRFKCFLFMGTNKPVRITDAKSGLIRRLIDISPTGNKVPVRQYNKAMDAINFELPGIAWHCKEVYESSPDEYQNYIPVNMFGASNDFYNFIEDSYDIFKAEDGVTLKSAWEMYKNYCEDAKVGYPYSKRAFKEELKNYFDTFEERAHSGDMIVYNLYSGFKFHLGGETEKKELKKLAKSGEWLKLDSTESLFDIYCKDYPAQYATADGIPSKKWVNCTTKLSDLKTTREHYVKVPGEIVTVDFDFKDENGNKDPVKNLEEASKWPPTYAEFSKSGAGVHLEYFYRGDTSKLSPVFAPNIEIKVATGNSALRRKLTYCNNLPIAEITNGLPLKGDKDVINFEGLANEKSIRTLIKENLNKKYHAGTKPSVDFIKKILDDAYESNIKYDVSDMRTAVVQFAAGSTHHAQECLKMVSNMHFKCKEILEDEKDLYPEQIDPPDPTPVFYDCEVFPNLFLVNWQKLPTDLFNEIMEEIRTMPKVFASQEKADEYRHEIIRRGVERNPEPMHRMINPKPKEVEDLMRHRLIGFNCRRYDNHMLYARMMGYSEEQLYNLSQKIITKNDKNAFFGEAYNISYTDIYDYASKKQSLKKWEIELGLRHLELGLPWDKPVHPDLWERVSEYCDNDVISTICTWIETQPDFLAREILADLAGGIVNDTTNSLTTRLIFGNNKKPKLNYRFLGDKPTGKSFTWEDAGKYARGETDIMPEGMPWFPGYEFEFVDKQPVSRYRGYEVGEGGRVYANPGSYGVSETQDVASMHPSSAIAEKAFGEYTDIFEELKVARVYIKHKDFDSAGKLFGGKLTKYLTDPTVAKNLAQALKIVINSVYGLTSAKFQNAFRDDRNVDNFVAKRGALFMIDLQLAVEELGYKVIHIKTDSIKVHHPDEFIRTFIQKFGKCYGYSFELEDAWDRICLVNDAVFIGHTEEGWKATGAEFAQPYVFKTLFTHEEITFNDLCETKSVQKGAIYLSDKEISNKAKEEPIDIPDMVYEEPKEDSSTHFIGRVSRFCPMKEGTPGAGYLYRMDNDKYYALSGTKGYLWMESEVVKNLGKEDDIDISYYEKMAHDAMGDIIAYGNFDAFVDLSKPYEYELPQSGEVPFMNPPVEEVPLELPFK